MTDILDLNDLNSAGIPRSALFAGIRSTQAVVSATFSAGSLDRRAPVWVELPDSPGYEVFVSDVEASCPECGCGTEACSYCFNINRFDWEAVCDCGLYDFGEHLFDCVSRLKETEDPDSEINKQNGGYLV